MRGPGRVAAHARPRDRGEPGDFAGLWAVPAGPYRSVGRRAQGHPLRARAGSAVPRYLAGFQHALVEYARHVLGWTDAGARRDRSRAARSADRALWSARWSRPANGSSCAPGRAWPRPTASARSSRATLSLRHQSRARRRAARRSARRQRRVRGRWAAGHRAGGASLLCRHAVQPERRALSGQAPPLVVAFLAAAAARRETAEELPCRSCPTCSPTRCC